MGNWEYALSASWFRDPSLKKPNVKKSTTLDLVHTFIPLKYSLPQLVAKKGCLFSPCSVGCSRSCETVQRCPGGVLSCYGNEFINLTFCWQRQVVSVRAWLAAIGLPDGLTPITAEPKFIDFVLALPWDDLLKRETVLILYFTPPTPFNSSLIPFVYFLLQ